ncbi:hypothetical protein JTB14_020190 [Gonioctena quinquepunctata]|nr:hypothetical protein JTB14_020190 [Gonioctena quinquepunctata]
MNLKKLNIGWERYMAYEDLSIPKCYNCQGYFHKKLNCKEKMVKNYITYECDIMYECRICKTIYRSLANFILHKRNYCREKFKSTNLINGNCAIQDYADSQEPPEKINILESRPLVTPDPISTSEQNTTKGGLSPVIEKLKQKQEINQLTREILCRDLSNENANANEVTSLPVTNNDFLLEEIATNNAAVFQTMLQSMPSEDVRKTEFMKSEVMEIHGILDSDEAVLGSDGKICSFRTNKINSNPTIPKNELICTECNMKFSTKKTLMFHLRNKHNNTRLVYVCPDCKDTFANAWCVYRHLYKVHRRTPAQVKRLRQQVHNSVIRKDQEPHKKGEKKEVEKHDKTDEENQWLNNIEDDNDFQMCGGCGKRFERKAALHSHAQMCIKRIAVCNTIKENNAKKKEEESKDIKNKLNKIDKPFYSDAPLQGASKRKPYLLRTYKVAQTQNICDVNDNSEIIETVCDNGNSAVIVKDSVLVVTKIPSPQLEDPNQLEGNKECVFTETGRIDTQKMLSIIGVVPNDRSRLIKTDTLVTPPDNHRSHTANDFDSFCQRVAPETGLWKGDLESEKKNLAVSLASSRATEVSEGKQGDVMVNKNENDLQCNTSKEVQMSPCRISIRSLEDLIGFPREEQEIIKSDENTILENIGDDTSRIILQSPETKISPKSPRNPRKNHCKPSKRKRTTSLDSANSKVLKKSDFDSLFDKQDISFTTKAAPYVDPLNLTCKACQLTYPTLSKLLWHMSKHFSWYRFQCSRCSFITFSKIDCADHAKMMHNALKSEIAGIVLPIPNWKTVLMSHEFRDLNDNKELGTNSTDLQEGCQDREYSAVATEKTINDNIINNLFVDSDEINIDLDDVTICHLPLVGKSNSIKNECIDIVDENKDSFQLEVPEEIPSVENLNFIKNESIDIVDKNEDTFQLEVPREIYSVDSYEIIQIGDSVDDRYNFRRVHNVKEEIIDNDDFVIINSAGVTELEEKESEKQTLHPIEENTIPKNDNFKKVVDPIMNLRPTRNRVRSIKTLQNDFFYDLGKVIKLNDSAVNKTNGPHKQKKSGSSANLKKGIRVYSNK